MRGSWRIGRIMGIDIAVDASWFIIVLLLIYTLGFVEFPRELHAGRRAFGAGADWISITLGVAATLLLFASVLAHELSHSWMALQWGIAVTRITLFVFGGVAQIADEPDRPASEFLIAIMGPLMSLVLALVFGAAWVWLLLLDSTRILGVSLTPLILLASILTQANGSLALFNLAPGFPLDGGRVLRAILWGAWHDIRRATKWASRAGQFIAVGLVGVGAFLFFIESNGGGIWYAFIGVFLWTAADQGYRQTLTYATLRAVRVEQLMVRNFYAVAPELTIAEFVDMHLLPMREQTFAVMNGSEFRGVISIDQIKRVPRAEWRLRRVSELMIPRHALAALAPQQNGGMAMARLSVTDAPELPVMDAGVLVGFLGRAELARYLQLHQ